MRRRDVAERGTGATDEAALRLAYVSGPVDAAQVYDATHGGTRLEYLGTSYLSQWYSVGEQATCEGLVITTLHDDIPATVRGLFRIENLPMPEGATGLAYHLGMLGWALRCVRMLARFRPDVVVVTAGQNYWFVFHLLRLRRTRIVAALHSVIWQPFGRQRPVNRALVWLNRGFYRYGIDAALAASLRSESQLRQLRGRRPLPIEVFLPTYTDELFGSVPSAPEEPPRGPFGVFFAGRIVENKGIFNMVEIADALRQSHPGQFHFHICGDGPELGALRAEIDRRGLDETMTTYGFRAGDEIAAIIRQCHVTLVPTRSSCEEGFNMVCAESVLFRRPVVTSMVCPALDFIRNSSLEVAPDDVAGYRSGLIRLLDDRSTYIGLVNGCEIDRAQFLDPDESYAARYERALRSALGRPTVLSGRAGHDAPQESIGSG